MIDEMIEAHFVPCSIWALRRLMNLDSQGLPVDGTYWTDTGRKAFISDDDVEDFVTNCGANNSGMTYTCASLKECIVSEHKVELNALDLTLFGVRNTSCATTMSSDMALVACHPNMHVCRVICDTHHG